MRRTVQIPDNSTTEEELRRVAEILFKLREKTKEWKEKYGHQSREMKEYWEGVADNWLNTRIKDRDVETISHSNGREENLDDAASGNGNDSKRGKIA